MMMMMMMMKRRRKKMMMMMKTRMRMRTRNSQELEQLNHVAEPFVRIWQTNTYWE